MFSMCVGDLLEAESPPPTRRNARLAMRKASIATLGVPPSRPHRELLLTYNGRTCTQADAHELHLTYNGRRRTQARLHNNTYTITVHAHKHRRMRSQARLLLPLLLPLLTAQARRSRTAPNQQPTNMHTSKTAQQHVRTGLMTMNDHTIATIDAASPPQHAHTNVTAPPPRHTHTNNAARTLSCTTDVTLRTTRDVNIHQVNERREENKEEVKMRK
jgi:hypothetical protein